MSYNNTEFLVKTQNLGTQFAYYNTVVSFTQLDTITY